MRSCKIFGRLVLVLAMLFVVAAPARPRKDSITYAIDSKFASMERYSSTQTFANNLWMIIGDGVVRRNHETLAHEPSLAESWRQLDDVTWEFKLRKGVKFHNGHEFTAEAVRFTIMDLIMNPEYKNPSQGYFKWVKEIKILDDYTFQIISDGPYPMVLDQMCFLTPYDPAYVKEKGFTYIQEHPIGTGPTSLSMGPAAPGLKSSRTRTTGSRGWATWRRSSSASFPNCRPGWRSCAAEGWT